MLSSLFSQKVSDVVWHKLKSIPRQDSAIAKKKAAPKWKRLSEI
jgi:hypothetical protein